MTSDDTHLPTKTQLVVASPSVQRSDPTPCNGRAAIICFLMTQQQPVKLPGQGRESRGLVAQSSNATQGLPAKCPDAQRSVQAKRNNSTVPMAERCMLLPAMFLSCAVGSSSK